jgi:hypothetical protein
MFLKIASGKVESTTLSEIRNALLPKLISGSIRVHIAEGVADGQ